MEIIVFLFGRVIGSFLNVCIYRLPGGLSIVHPGSFCPGCKHPIAWFDNIPVFSYIALRGKCRNCKKSISARYPLVELLTASLFVILLVAFGPGVKFLAYLILSCGLIIATFTDFDHRIIPDVISCPGIIVGFLISVLYPPLHGSSHPWNLLFSLRGAAILDSLSGILVGGGVLYALGILGKAIFKKEAMGGGDVKLLAMIGAFAGWRLALLTVFISSVIGSIAGLIIKIKSKNSYIPYGPYLAIASLISIIWGESLISWYVAKLVINP